MKAIQILFASRCNISDELLRREAGFFRRDHDRRAVCIVGTDEIDCIALHALESHPDVGLDVFHDVADMECAIGVGQGGGDEKFARQWVAHKVMLGNKVIKA